MKTVNSKDCLQVKQPGAPVALTADTYFGKAVLKKQFQAGRAPLREVSCRLQLDPGFYCIIPNTLRPNMETQFLLRIFTYAKAESGYVLYWES